MSTLVLEIEITFLQNEFASWCKMRSFIDIGDEKLQSSIVPLHKADWKTKMILKSDALHFLFCFMN